MLTVLGNGFYARRDTHSTISPSPEPFLVLDEGEALPRVDLANSLVARFLVEMLVAEVPDRRVEDDSLRARECALGKGKRHAADALVLRLRLDERAAELDHPVCEPEENETADDPLADHDLEVMALLDRLELPACGLVARRPAGTLRSIMDVVVEGAPRYACENVGITPLRPLDPNRGRAALGPAPAYRLPANSALRPSSRGCLAPRP